MVEFRRNNARSHIFISYASEQSMLCDWLARRLASIGYAVWYDRLKLLGGEDWPKDIDLAIKNRTYRMLALLSQESINKQHPRGEWQKGLAVGRQHNIEDFVIPLNTDGLRPDEIPWNLQTINYIPFSSSWADGLVQLLKKLSSIDAPRTLQDGPRIAIESVHSEIAVRNEPEILVSNCFQITQIPRYISKYEAFSKLTSKSRRQIVNEWACYALSPRHVLAFDDPPSSVTDLMKFRYVETGTWRDKETVFGINPRNLVVTLLHKCLHRLLSDNGMKYYSKGRTWYLPPRLLKNDRISVTFPSQKKSWFKGVGERIYTTKDGGEVYRYHLSPSFSVLHNQDDPYVVFLRNRVHLTDVTGVPLNDLKSRSRRKHLCKNWFNEEWCARSLGIAQLLADEDMKIRYGKDGEQQLIIDAMPIQLNAPRRIQDELVDAPDESLTTWHDSGEERGEDAGVDE
ncbi:MAG: toll/interleukin-1 receptor domain-containing protein [Gemmatimonadetes bacterium]|nr:toll/interleukin-1 receptor domain-containing protein [Gemmatimonadota bacterium]